MKKVEELYQEIQTEDRYKGLDEKKILTSLYHEKSGTIQMAISKVINQAIVEHMNIEIDSTIMQVLSLNEYLSGLFIKDFEPLVNNYIIYDLQQHHIEYVNDCDEMKISEIKSKVQMSTYLEELISEIERRWLKSYN